MNLLMQGDVALKPVEKVVNGAETVENKVLAWGETSGHAHVVTGHADVFMINGTMYVVTGSDGATLEHQLFETKAKADHESITLEPNQTYQVLLQNEYNPFAQALQRVID